MDKSEKSKFAYLFLSLCSTFDKEQSEALLNGYWFALRDLDFDSFSRGIVRALRECKYFPKPAELRALCGEQDTKALASCEFEKVVKAIGSHGRSNKPEFDPLTERAIKSCGGWKRLCSSTTDDLHNWIRKRFEDDYAIFTEAQKKEPTALPGTNKKQIEATVSEIEKLKKIA